MVQLTVNRDNIHEKSMHYNTVLKDSSKDVTNSDNITNIRSNETYQPLANKNDIQEVSNNFKKHTKWGIVWFCLCCFIISLLLLLNSLVITKQNYEDIEIQIMVDINNDDAIEETRYQHILIDTSDIYIDQQDYEKISFGKVNNLPGKNIAVGSEVSKI